MSRKSLYRAAFLALGLAVPGLAATPAHAGSPSQTVDGTAKDGLDFRVCRIPGLDTAMSNQTIEIPAGTEYDENHPALDDSAAARSSARPSFMVVVTTKPEALPANGFCVTAPVKPRGNADAATIRASTGAMFEPNGNWHDLAAVNPISLTYGYWQSAQD